MGTQDRDPLTPLKFCKYNGDAGAHFFIFFELSLPPPPTQNLPYFMEFHVKFHMEAESDAGNNFFGFPTPKMGGGQGGSLPGGLVVPVENVQRRDL